VEKKMYGHQVRRTVKFEPTNIRYVTSGQAVTYSIPPGAVYDLSTLRMHVKGAHGPTVDPAPIATIPSPCECVIDTLNVSVGGDQMNQISNYGQLFAAWSRFNTPARDFGRRMMTSAASSAMQNPTDRRAPGTMRFIISSWLGLLGSGAKLDTEKRGPLSIEIVFADDQMLGTKFVFKSFITVDVLPSGTGDDAISYADYRTGLTPSVHDAPFGVLQTHNSPDHRLMYVCATILENDYKANATVPVRDLGFTRGFQHTRLGTKFHRFEWDGNCFTHDIAYWEFLDRLKEAMASSSNSLELPLLMARGNDLQLKELCDSVFLAGESAIGKGIPDGPVQVTFRTTREDPVDCHVFMFARYACVF
jgi:hypothetical protein